MQDKRAPKDVTHRPISRMGQPALVMGASLLMFGCYATNNATLTTSDGGGSVTFYPDASVSYLTDASTSGPADQIDGSLALTSVDSGAGTNRGVGLGASDAGTVASVSIDAGAAQSACIPAAAPNGSGHHYPGLDCNSCHANLSANLRWTIAGTLFSALSGGAPVAGATIVITDANGQKLQLVTASNGNFYTTTPYAAPAQVQASQCPNSATMPIQLAASGSCDTCHVSGMQIHLP